MLPNTTEQWKNDDGKSVLVKCINDTNPTDNMTVVNTTDTRNGTTFQVSLQGEQVQICFFISLTFLKIIYYFLSTDYDAGSEGPGNDLFDVVGGNNTYDDFISEQSAHESENTSALIDNQEAYNVSGNLSLYDNISDQFVSKESNSDTEMEEGKYKSLFQTAYILHKCLIHLT